MIVQSIIEMTKERDELGSKIENLNTFLYSKEYEKLNPYEKQLLETQAHAMVTYFSILQLRIDDEIK